VSDQISYEAPRPPQNALTVTIPLTYFNMLVESYYQGRREPQQVVQQPLERPQTDEQFINSNFNGIDLLEDMPPGWARVKKKADTNGK
jgi:hypothetical protein